VPCRGFLRPREDKKVLTSIPITATKRAKRKGPAESDLKKRKKGKEKGGGKRPGPPFANRLFFAERKRVRKKTGPSVPGQFGEKILSTGVSLGESSWGEEVGVPGGACNGPLV